MKVFFAALAGSLMLAACAGSANRPAVPPAPEQSPAEIARQRAKIHTELGMAYLDAGQLTTALDEARIALKSDPGYGHALNLLGLAHMQMKENVRAEDYFEQALRLAPGDPEISNNMGWFLCQTGRETRSFSYFESASSNPLYLTPARPLVNAGICATRLKDYKRAEDYFSQALRRDPNAVDGMFLLADALYHQERYGEARARLADVHRRAEPTAASTWLALRIERKSGEREAEMRWISQLRRRFADSPEYKKLTQGIFE